MIDLLIRWPDRDAAVACGQALGCTSMTDGGDAKTADVFGVINLSVIGQHSYIADDSDPENIVTATVPGWWVLVRVPAGFDLAATLAPLGPLAPEVAWASDSGEPRPPIEVAPQMTWA